MQGPATPRHETKLYARYGTNGGTVRTFVATVRIVRKKTYPITPHSRVKPEQFTTAKNEQSYSPETEQSNTTLREQFEQLDGRGTPLLGSLLSKNPEKVLVGD